MPAPSAVLFDLDQTLLDRTASLAAFLQDQYRRFDRRLGQVSGAAWQARFISLDENGYAHKSVVYPAILSEFGGDVAAADALLADYRECSCLHAQVFPGTIETLTALRLRGIKLGIVTNGETEFQTRNIRALHLHEFVDIVLISEHEGLRKPDPRLFARAAERLGIAPAACWFVGDNPKADILGAHAAGMKAVWFGQGNAWPEEVAMPGSAIRSLPEILTLLDP